MGFSIEPDEGTLHLDPLPLTLIVIPAKALIELSLAGAGRRLFVGVSGQRCPRPHRHSGESPGTQL